jgi:hypothetical protein
MLCDTCKNKHICKHFEYFKNITINLAIQIEHCELFSNNQQAKPPVNNPSKPLYRQPLPSSVIEESEEELEDEERVFIDITNCDKEPHSATIVDLFMKGDLTDDQEKN